MAMRRENRLIGIGNAFAHLFEHVAIFIRRRIAHRIRQIDRGRTGFDGGIDRSAEIFNRGAGRIHRRPFDIRNQIARACDSGGDDIEHFRFTLLHLEFEMNG